MLKMKAKVKIISSKKTSGLFNFGRIVGIELIQSGIFLGYRSEREFISSFAAPRYKVAYIDCVTKRACTEWYAQHEIERA